MEKNFEVIGKERENNMLKVDQLLESAGLNNIDGILAMMMILDSLRKEGWKIESTKSRGGVYYDIEPPTAAEMSNAVKKMEPVKIILPEKKKLLLLGGNENAD